MNTNLKNFLTRCKNIVTNIFDDDTDIDVTRHTHATTPIQTEPEIDERRIQWLTTHREKAVRQTIMNFSMYGAKLSKNDVECLMKVRSERYDEVLRIMAPRYNIMLVD